MTNSSTGPFACQQAVVARAESARKGARKRLAKGRTRGRTKNTDFTRKVSLRRNNGRLDSYISGPYDKEIEPGWAEREHEEEAPPTHMRPFASAVCGYCMGPWRARRRRPWRRRTRLSRKRPLGRQGGGRRRSLRLAVLRLLRGVPLFGMGAGILGGELHTRILRAGMDTRLLEALMMRIAAHSFSRCGRGKTIMRTGGHP
jgi:hypothetical protein